MARSRRTAPPYRWGTLEPLPWPKSCPFKIAKAQIQNHAIEISKLPYQDIKTQRDMYAAEFVSNKKDWIPQNRQAWTKSCISRMMSCKIRDTRRNRRDGRTTPSASQEIQDSSVANEPSDNNQPTPPRVLPNNDHRDNNHGVSNHGDNNYGDSNYEDNDRTHNETIATTDNVPCYTRSTRAVSLDFDDAKYHTEAPTVDDKFGPSALKQYNIRLSRLVNDNLQTTKRIPLWLCGNGTPTRSSLIDIGHLSFGRLARLANLSVTETLTYAYARSPTGYMQITDDADFITAIQYLITHNASPVDDLVLYIIQEA